MSGSWSSTPRPSSWDKSSEASEVVLKPDDISLARSPDPEFHHPARPAADAAQTVGGPAGDENLLSSLRPPNPFAEGHLQAGVEHNPEFAPAAVVLQGKRPAGADGDDLKASGGKKRIRPEFSPRTDLLFDFIPDLDARPIRRFSPHARSLRRGPRRPLLLPPGSPAPRPWRPRERDLRPGKARPRRSPRACRGE